LLEAIVSALIEPWYILLLALEFHCHSVLFMSEFD